MRVFQVVIRGVKLDGRAKVGEAGRGKEVAVHRVRIGSQLFVDPINVPRPFGAASLVHLWVVGRMGRVVRPGGVARVATRVI